jgi:hypothetical protein
VLPFEYQVHNDRCWGGGFRRLGCWPASVSPAVYDFPIRARCAGIVKFDGADAVALFWQDGTSRKPALVWRFRRSKKSDWQWIARPVDGAAVTVADVIILRKAFERCEQAWGLFDASRADGRSEGIKPSETPSRA